MIPSVYGNAMSYRRTPFAPGEHYHCYTRGIDGRTTFKDTEDYERFQEALYLCNDVKPFDRSSFLTLAHADIFTRPCVREVVAIGFYSLMPNHFHIGFQEIDEGGSSKFLQKLGTSYCMYFNAKYERIGGLFVKPCRSRHINTDCYLRRVAQYVHLNIAEIYEPGWKRGVVKDMSKLRFELAEYEYSSLRDYVGPPRPEKAVLNTQMMQLIRTDMPPFDSVVRETREYYANLNF